MVSNIHSRRFSGPDKGLLQCEKFLQRNDVVHIDRLEKVSALMLLHKSVEEANGPFRK
jgi:hypothetical protein